MCRQELAPYKYGGEQAMSARYWLPLSVLPASLGMEGGLAGFDEQGATVRRKEEREWEAESGQSGRQEKAGRKSCAASAEHSALTQLANERAGTRAR